MTRQLVIEVTCDLCHRAVAEIEAREVPLVWDERSYVIDVCGPCEIGLMSKKLSVVLAAARPTKPEKATRKAGEWLERYEHRGRYRCPAEGCDKTTPTGQGLATHYGSKHGARLSELA